MNGFNVHLKTDRSRRNKNPKWQMPKKLWANKVLRTLKLASEFWNSFWVVLWSVSIWLRRAKYETECQWQGYEACSVVVLWLETGAFDLFFQKQYDFLKYCLWNAVSFNGILLLLLSNCVRWGVVKVWSEVTPIRWMTGWSGLKVVRVNWALDRQPQMALWQYCRCHRVLLALISGRHQSVVAALHSNVIGRDMGIEPNPNRRTNRTRTMMQKKTKTTQPNRTLTAVENNRTWNEPAHCFPRYTVGKSNN